MEIRGRSVVSLEAARSWARARGADPRYVNVAALYWTTAPRYGIPPEIPYVQAGKETNNGRYTGVVPASSHNWAGIKTRRGGADTDPAAHAAFDSDAEGVLAHVQHLARYAGATLPAAGDDLVDPRWFLVTARVTTVAELGAWATGAGYGADLERRVRDLIAYAEGFTMPTQTPRVVLAAGHRNASGGNATEQRLTGELTPLIAQALRRRGLDVRVITPDDGRGMFPGGLDAVAGQVRADDDLFLEVHTEGNNAGDAGRGVFAIYPDWDGDVDTDVRDRLGPDIARRVSAASGIPVRGSGVLSEKRTGVGIDGFRLGVFRVTAPLRARTTRLIVEYGAHSSPADMALWRRPGAVAAMAEATADAIAAFYGIAAPVPEDPPAGGIPPAVPDPWRSPGRPDLWILAAFVEDIEAGRWMDTGYSLGGAGMGTAEDGVAVHVQDFERARLELRPDGRVTRARVVVQLREAEQRIRELEAALAAAQHAQE